MFSMNQIWNRVRQMTLTTLLVSVVWIVGFSFISAQALPSSEMSVEGERLSAVIKCLPEELSEPDLGRALKEMGNDYLERTFQLKDNPKLNQAEIEFRDCLESQGYTLQAEKVRNPQQNS
ncbi:MAG: hypothetical protein SWJ54_21450 [Cyanobacteriota bacterium]|nr:hypothetical protein [Cyanobacteriota bacterium]